MQSFTNLDLATSVRRAVIPLTQIEIKGYFACVFNYL